MTVLETQRLYLRPITASDLGPLALLWSNPDVMRYLPSGKPRTVQATRDELEYMLHHWQEHKFGTWVIEQKDSRKWIGYCELQYLHAEPCGVSAEIAAQVKEVELGYGLAKPYWGKGIAFEAAQAAARYGFETLKLPQIVAAIHRDNIASRKILERIGLREDPSLNFYGTCPHFRLRREDFSIPA